MVKGVARGRRQGMGVLSDKEEVGLLWSKALTTPIPRSPAPPAPPCTPNQRRVHSQRIDRAVGLHGRRPAADHRRAAATTRHVVTTLGVHEDWTASLGGGNRGDDCGGKVCVELAAKGATRATNADINTRGTHAERLCQLGLRAARVLIARPYHPPPVLLRACQGTLRLKVKVLLPTAIESSVDHAGAALPRPCPCCRQSRPRAATAASAIHTLGGLPTTTP